MAGGGNSDGLKEVNLPSTCSRYVTFCVERGVMIRAFANSSKPHLQP